MTVILLRGTRLAAATISKPLTRPFLLTLTFLFLLNMHYFQHNQGGSGLMLPFNVSSWIPFSFAIAIGLLEVSRQKILRYSRLTLVFFLCCVMLTLPVFYPEASPAGAANRLFALWAGWLFFVALQQFAFSQKQRQQILWLILKAVWLQTALAWYMFIWISPENGIGYDTVVNRPYGIFQQPNVMASFLATGLVLSAYLMARQPMIQGRWAFPHLGLLFTPVAVIPMLVVLSSRTGWIAAVIGTLLILPYLLQFAARVQWRLWLLMVALGLSLAWNLTDMLSWAPQPGRVSLESARAIIYPQVTEMFQHAPMRGVGYGNFEAAYMLQTAQWHQADPSQPYGLPGLDHPHNELLFWASEGGILPLLGLLLAATAVLAKIRRAPANTQLALVALIFPITLHTQLEYPFYHSLAHWVIFIVLLYWIDALSAKYFKQSLRFHKPFRFSAILLPAGVSAFMLTTLYSGAMLTRFETTVPPDQTALEKVNNTWSWQHRYEWDLYQSQLKNGIAQNHPEQIQSFIRWAAQKAQEIPRPILYQFLIIAHQALGQASMAAHVREEAMFLFPGQDFSDAALPVLKVPTLPAAEPDLAAVAQPE
ncbi:PglL family O-oligosaccharyltransferase [Photobacterium sp. 1_MG-2023]|uniref:PglL family O-oligosaccharyltransferase n=1 Tax=Photobacterium sp. 1_MG-2023 TaxID=3062646 RepID=UPI0026E460DE|nr:Wzy polymerase domain-containing protein [Photobacterium sp. 1_MG-2023]MDO6706368.1 Wzy polymerase domain-containing protein [Photobacterium sp. 1_MG-2023]